MPVQKSLETYWMYHVYIYYTITFLPLFLIPKNKLTQIIDKTNAIQ